MILQRMDRSMLRYSPAKIGNSVIIFLCRSKPICILLLKTKLEEQSELEEWN